MESLPATARLNIQTHQDLLDSGLQPGDRVHIGVCGNHVNEDAHYVGPWLAKEADGALDMVEVTVDGRPVMTPKLAGVRIRIGKHEHDLYWGDIIELWQVSLQKRLPEGPKALPEAARG